MIIKEIHKSYSDKTIIRYNQHGLIIYEKSYGREENYFYDETNRIIRVERFVSTDDPNEWEIKYRDEYVYNGSDFKVITYKIQSRAINDDWYSRDEITSIREAKFEGKNKTLDRTTYIGSGSIKCLKRKYSRDTLIYEESYDVDGTYFKKEYLNNNLILQEEKAHANWEESKYLISKTIFKYIDNRIVEEKHYVKGMHVFTMRNSYLSDVLVKKSKYNITGGCEVIRNYTDYLYSDSGELVKIELYEYFKGTNRLCKYEVIEHEEIESGYMQKTVRQYSNEEYYDLSQSNIDYSRCHLEEFWLEKWVGFGDKLNIEQFNGYVKQIDEMFANWTFDLTSEKIELKNDKGHLIKTSFTKPIGAKESSSTLTHYEYNENGDLEFILELNPFGIMSNLSKYYYS